MNRRDLIRSAGLGAAFLAAPRVIGAQTAKVLSIIPQSSLGTLDPVLSQVNVTRNHGLMVFDTLYGLDSALQPQPQMVEGHQVSDDGRIWDMTLRPGLLFHDGTPVLARDAVASIMRWAKRDALGGMVLAATDEISAPSDRAIRFRLKRPFPLLPALLGKMQASVAVIMPERLARTDPFTAVTEMVGSGPFRFVAKEYVAGAFAAYDKNAAYVPRDGGGSGNTAGPKVVNVSRVEWHMIPDPATGAAAMQAGQIDWWERPTADLLPLMRRDPNLVVKVNDPFGGMETLRLNHRTPPFDNPAIRRALLRALDQKDMMTASFGDDPSLQQSGIGIFAPASPWANDAGLAVLTGPRDLEAAKREIMAAGYDGKKLVMLVGSDIPDIAACSQVGAEVFRKIGLNVDYVSADWATISQRINSDKPLDQGGWSCFFVPVAGLDNIDPAASVTIRGNGKTGASGWQSVKSWRVCGTVGLRQPTMRPVRR